MDTIEEKIRNLAKRHLDELKSKTDDRMAAMDEDDNSHFLIYRVFGITKDEGILIDRYQNKGRFLYKYAGAFLEIAARTCFQENFPDAKPKRIENTLGRKPSKFEIDVLLGDVAYEIKWRDATTDGDHITKEHTRIQVIKAAGYTPKRIMFFYPNRDQAIRIQQTLETLYTGIGGEYYFGDMAWAHLKEKSGVDLLGILKKLANENERS